MLNNKFEELKAKYKKYKRQKRRKVYLSALLFFIVAGGSIYAFSFFNAHKEQFIVQTEREPVKEIVEKQVIETKKSIVQKENNTTQEESTKVVKKEKNVKQVEQSIKQKAVKKEVQAKSKPTINMKVSKQDSHTKLVNDYEANKNYASAMKLANYHFGRKNYEQSVKWAITSSKKKPKSTLPWLIYAKSKIALGQKQAAIRALQTYLKHYNSYEAQKLLQETTKTD